jgi:hypothetical protein
VNDADATTVYSGHRPTCLLASQIPHDAYLEHNKGFIRDEGQPTRPRHIKS